MKRLETEVVIDFNDAINRRSLDGLVALMTDDHRFVDSAGSVVEGRDGCRAAWASFFAAFPDYRNVFDDIVLLAEGQVEITGHSECSVAELAGPATWRAEVRDDLVAEWRVEDPTEPRS